MNNVILTLSIILLCSLSSPIISQEKTQEVEKKVMIIKSADVDSEKEENIWISKDGESIDVKDQDMIFIGEDVAESDKDISVNINKEMRNGEEFRIFEISISEDGKEKIVKWEDNGSIPEDVATMLEEEGIDIQMFEKDEVTVVVDATEDSETESDKSVHVNMDVEEVDGETERNVEITIEEDGEKQVMKWTDNGETPSEIQEKLDEMGIDLENVAKGEHREDVEVIIEKMDESEIQNNDDDSDVEMRKYKIDLSDGGEVPAEIRKELEEYGVDLDAIIEEAKEQKEGDKKLEKKVKIIKSKDGGDADSDVEIIRLKDGEELPDDIKQKLKDKGIDIESLKSGDVKIGSKKSQKHVIKIKGDDGEMKVMEWDGEGEMPAEMKKHMKKMEKEGHSIHLKSNESVPANKAQLGVMIGEGSSEGTLVSDVIPDSAADKIGIQNGDIITHIDGQAVTDITSLLKSLSNKNPNDSAKIRYKRNGVSYNATAQLTKPK